MVSIGEKAPNFTLYATNRSEVSLSDYLGKKVVLLFFPFAFSSVCTEELCQVRDDQSAYDALDAEVIGISLDSLFTLDRFKAEQGYTFPLLSDWNKETARAYGALNEGIVLGMQGVGKRAAFVVDREGIIRYHEILANAGELPDFAAIKETLSKLS